MAELCNWESYPGLPGAQSLSPNSLSSLSANFQSCAPDLFDPSDTEVEIWTMTSAPSYEWVKVKAKSTEVLKESLMVTSPGSANEMHES